MPVLLRPHHGMCIGFYEGKGYSTGFTDHMSRVIRLLSEDTPVRITSGPDEICSRCPNLDGAACLSDEKVRRYDRMVLDMTGIEDGTECTYGTFSRSVSDHIILPGRRREICGDCEWDEICRRKEKALCSAAAGK